MNWKLAYMRPEELNRCNSSIYRYVKHRLVGKQNRYGIMQKIVVILRWQFYKWLTWRPWGVSKWISIRVHFLKGRCMCALVKDCTDNWTGNGQKRNPSSVVTSISRQQIHHKRLNMYIEYGCYIWCSCLSLDELRIAHTERLTPAYVPLCISSTVEHPSRKCQIAR